MKAWITDAIPWRYALFSSSYFRLLKMASKCPEIRGEINRSAFWRLIRLLTTLPLLVPLTPLAILQISSQWLADLLDGLIDFTRRLRPDFDSRIDGAIHAAHEKLSRDEIRERMGGGRILSKKSDIA